MKILGNILRIYHDTFTVQYTKIIFFSNLSFGFILEVFLEFCKFHLRYSNKSYCYRKKKNAIKTVRAWPTLQAADKWTLVFYFELARETKIGSGNWGSAVREIEGKLQRLN